MSSEDHEIFIGRQPILDRGQNLAAFELLFRSGLSGGANVSDDLQATATVITRSFSDLGLHAVLGKYRGFINVSADLLMSDMLELLPQEQVVLELLETIQITDDIVARCRDLKAMGFSLALDDFIAYDPVYEPLLEVVEVVKIDLPQLEIPALEQLVRQLKPWPVQLLAEKVDSAEQAERCRQLGFHFFQGYYFAKPVVLTGKRSDPSKLALLRLLGLILSDAETHEIEQAFKHNPTLSYNLMRLVNSVAMGMSHKINSLTQAIVVLGRRQLQRWLQLLLFTADASDADFPTPLMLLAATRGKMAELLAKVTHPRDRDYQDRAFTAGIMSLLDALLGMPMHDILQQLNLAEDVQQALLAREGPIGLLLRLAEKQEGNDLEGMAAMLAQEPNLTLGDVTRAGMEAMLWANNIGEEG
jgi:EAL and modified HD-GYP domain-containing signal transduction protein